MGERRTRANHHPLASYYRQFVRNFDKVANPLHQLTRKGAAFKWTKQLLSHSKYRLTSPPVLAYPNSFKGFVLDTDASKICLGAVLSQIQDDQRLHPVSYASRSLTSPEKNYWRCVYPETANFADIIKFLETNKLLQRVKDAQRVARQALWFEGILYFVDTKP